MNDKQKLTRAELNQMAAEKVMAGLVCSCEISCRHFTYDGVCAACGIRMAGDFASDPAASKRLRDKMRADGWSYEIGYLRAIPGVFAAGFQRRELPPNHGATADSEELAVIIAALRAVGAISGEVEVTE